MDTISTQPPERTPARNGSSVLRAPGAALAALGGLLALAVPVDDSGSATAGPGASISSFETGDRCSLLPVGWPNPSPALTNQHEEAAWATLWKHAERFDVTGEALVMFEVIWRESRCLPHVTSDDGLYHGIAQFLPSTFEANVREMKRRGLVRRDVRYSPMNPDQALEVMAFMWSEGYADHWGPYRRLVREGRAQELRSAYLN